MKSNTVKYIIKVTPTFSQKFGFGVLSMLGGIVGGVAAIYVLACIAVHNKNRDSDKKVSDIKDFINRVNKEESGKE